MNEQEFQTKLAELMGEISTLPPTERQKLEKLAEAKNFGQGHIPARSNTQRSLLDNHIRAHVAVSERLAQAKAFWSGKSIPAPK